MAFKLGRRILGQLPIWNTANTAGPLEPLISEPSRRPTVSGIGDPKGLIAMSGDPGPVTDDLKRFDAM